MPRIDAVVECPVHDSFRVRQVAGMFGLEVSEQAGARFAIDLPGLDEDWQLGVIVGPSGSGKTTVARAAYGDAVQERFDWPMDKAVIDGFEHRSTREVCQMLTAVGFSSPPAWLKPYAVLSNGERFRCDLARALLTDAPLVVFDEFTSVVDRTVAQIGSAAVARAVRSGNVTRRLVAVTCHDDVLPWLEPDWVADLASGALQRRCLRRPEIPLEIFRCERHAWQLFSPHHYLSGTINHAAHCYVACRDERPVAFCAVLALAGKKGSWRISRIVVLPDYQGVGIGHRLLDAIAELYFQQGRRMYITTSHPAMIAALRRSVHWATTSIKKTGHAVQTGARTGKLHNYIASASLGRAVVSFAYRPPRGGRLSQTLTEAQCGP